MTEEEPKKVGKAAAVGLLAGLPAALLLAKGLGEESSLSLAYNWVKGQFEKPTSPPEEPEDEAETARREREQRFL